MSVVRAVIQIMECPFHKVRALYIRDTRITSLKCCGCWNVVEEFRVCDSPEDIMQLLEDDIEFRTILREEVKP